MRIFAIRNEEREASGDLAYLLYYEKTKRFYIEILEKVTGEEAPLLLSSFVKRGEYSVGPQWSRVWVQQRIKRSQNQKEYDEMKLLWKAKGRCPQDSCYMVEITREPIPGVLLERKKHRVADVLVLKDGECLVFFHDGSTVKLDMYQYGKDRHEFQDVLFDEEMFQMVTVQPDGYGIEWDDTMMISYQELRECGEKIDVSLEAFLTFAKSNLISTAEVTQMLSCSRQNVDDLVKRNKLTPVKQMPKSKLFLKTDVEQRLK